MQSGKKIRVRGNGTDVKLSEPRGYSAAAMTRWVSALCEAEDPSSVDPSTHVKTQEWLFAHP